jgi:DAK2 domain fusion protein YloV
MQKNNASTISIKDLDAAFKVAENWLSINRESINSINVYPVPDGDTGTNMLLTLKAAISENQKKQYKSISEFTNNLATGALLGARGNSGVILSQMLKGFSDSFKDKKEISAKNIAHGLESAAKAAYEALANPVEGTMLSVLRDAAKSAMQSIKKTTSITETLEASIKEAKESVEKTKEQLPELIEAGVVDAGAIGVLVILEGLYFGISKISPPELPKFQVVHLNFDHSKENSFGFCTEFLIKNPIITKQEMEKKLAAINGQSIIVVGDSNIMHVHIHVEVPDNAIAVGKEIGIVENIKIENMQEQHEQMMKNNDTKTEIIIEEIGIIAIVQGSGLKDIYNELGVMHFIDGGQGANPNSGKMLNMAKKIASKNCIILANNKNIIASAEQAAELSKGFIKVIPTTSPAIGIVAALDYLTSGNIEQIIKSMKNNIYKTKSIEITTAVKTTIINNLQINSGDYMAMINGEIVAIDNNFNNVLNATLSQIADSELITLYTGDMINSKEREELSNLLNSTFKQLDIELYNGGQPLYHILGSIE